MSFLLRGPLQNGCPFKPPLNKNRLQLQLRPAPKSARGPRLRWFSAATFPRLSLKGTTFASLLAFAFGGFSKWKEFLAFICGPSFPGGALRSQEGARGLEGSQGSHGRAQGVHLLRGQGTASRLDLGDLFAVFLGLPPGSMARPHAIKK